MSLYLDIHKKLGSFSLDLSARTDRECMGILGASGCGKSMTLKCVAGIMMPDRGRIVLNGRVLYDSEQGICLSPQDRRVGYLFQNYALFPGMTVKKNIGVGLRSRSRAEREERLRELIGAFHLEGLENLYPRQLSGGQQQRTALARILAYEPDVLLLDEPFSALDSFLKEQLQFEVQKVLRRYRGDVLMVTHSRDEVYRFCRSVTILDDGQMVDSGETKELFRNPKTLTAAKLSGCKNFSAARKTGAHTLWAQDWNLELTSGLPVPDDVSAVGIRAHDFIPVSSSDERKNCFHAVYVDCSEGPFEVSVRMRVNGNDVSEENKYIWWKLETPLWEADYRKAMPPVFSVNPEKVMPLR